MTRFYQHTGNTGKLRTNENYLNFKWNDSNILFSVTRQGNAATCHFTSDKEGLRRLEQALNEWCEFVFWMFDWCEMVIGIIERKSIEKLALKCGFERLGKIQSNQIYIRRS